jgi:hypothetical protein
MKPTLKDIEIHTHFDSLAELKDWVIEGDGRTEEIRKNPRSFGSVLGEESSAKSSREQSWDLGAGWDGAVAMATGSGWEEGAEKIRTILSGIECYSPDVEMEANTNSFTFEFDEEGDEFDVGALLSGDDRPWLQTKFESTKPIVRILCDVCASAGVDARAMLGRGCVIAAVASKLERIGFGVQIFIGFSCRGGGQRFASTVRVKDSDERVDEAALAFWMAHPAAFRRIGFRVIEASEADWLGYGYGTPTQIESDDFDLISPSAHLQRARVENWGSNPDAAAKATLEIVDKILSGQLEKVEAIGE